MISVIVPVYNSEKTLYTCLNSILKQTYQDFEIICIDDDSNDSSLEILDYFSKKDSRIQILKNSYHKGLCYCLNKCLNVVKGDFIFFLKSADWISFDAFEALSKKVEGDFLDVLLFKNSIYNETTHTFSSKSSDFDYMNDYDNKIFNHSDLNMETIFKAPFDLYNCLYSKPFLDKNKILFTNENKENSLTEFFYKSFIYAKNISLINKTLYILRTSINNAPLRSNNEILVEKIEKSYQIFKVFLDNAELYKNYKKQLFNYINDILDIDVNQIDYEHDSTIFYKIRDFFKKLILRYGLTEDIQNNLDAKLLDKFRFDEILFELDSSYPLISVIIPIYNVEDYLRECLDSVLNQTFYNFEVICVNDGSQDNSPDILNEYSSRDKRVTVINQENCGLGCARNSGFKHSKGDYVVFIDSDDYISDKYIELLYYNMISNHSDMAFSKIIRFTDDEITYTNPAFPLDEDFIDVNFNRFVFDYKNIKRYVLNTSFSAVIKMYKKEFLNKFNLKFPQNTAFEDVLFHVQTLLNASKLSFVPEFLYYYRISNENSIIHDKSKAFDIIKVCDSVEKYLKNSNNIDEFKLEFLIFKISQLYQYIESSKDEKYFMAVKDEFKILSEHDTLLIEKLPEIPKTKFNKVLNADNLNEFLELLK